MHRCLGGNWCVCFREPVFPTVLVGWETLHCIKFCKSNGLSFKKSPLPSTERAIQASPWSHHGSPLENLGLCAVLLLACYVDGDEMRSDPGSQSSSSSSYFEGTLKTRQREKKPLTVMMKFFEGQILLAIISSFPDHKSSPSHSHLKSRAQHLNTGSVSEIRKVRQNVQHCVLFFTIPGLPVMH